MIMFQKTIIIAIAQPTIRPLFNTASATRIIVSLGWFSKSGGKDSKVVYDLMRSNWASNESFPTNKIFRFSYILEYGNSQQL
jgi:hypothetical protein